MFNYPYDIINNTAQPHGNQKGVSLEPGSNSFVTAKGFSLQCAISGYFLA